MVCALKQIQTMLYIIYCYFSCGVKNLFFTKSSSDIGQFRELYPDVGAGLTHLNSSVSVSLVVGVSTSVSWRPLPPFYIALLTILILFCYFSLIEENANVYLKIN